jgi:hypothetical protein
MLPESCGPVVQIQMYPMSCASRVAVPFVFGVCKYNEVILEFHTFQIHYLFICSLYDYDKVILNI